MAAVACNSEFETALKKLGENIFAETVKLEK